MSESPIYISIQVVGNFGNLPPLLGIKLFSFEDNRGILQVVYIPNACRKHCCLDLQMSKFHHFCGFLG